MKKVISGAIVGGLVVLGCVCYAESSFARSFSEARAACEKEGTVVKTIPCAYVVCNVNGVEREYLYECSNSSNSNSSSSSSSSSSSRPSSSEITAEINRRRDECKSKGGTFNATVSGGYVNSTCTVNGQTEDTSGDVNSGGSEMNTPSNSAEDSSGGGAENGSGSAESNGSYNSGTTWNTDNSGAKGANACNDENKIYTNLFGCVDADSNAVFMILNVILQVLTWGIGIAGTLGIVVTGFQYMTARDDVTQMTKAKNRLIQIVIGLAIYAVMWAFLQWLLPGGVFGS